ncbi:hypothetical protein [Saccharopolyspora antimicrobica]|uniref:hypothetical protein n=1 Tax=Saccharopolyspora antimicrobica TaxID=455193 RepID=UPI0011601E5E|nr:hypothetical protein [Saccharopolyspora antimicrobica]
METLIGVLGAPVAHPVAESRLAVRPGDDTPALPQFSMVDTPSAAADAGAARLAVAATITAAIPNFLRINLPSSCTNQGKNEEPQ